MTKYDWLTNYIECLISLLYLDDVTTKPVIEHYFLSIAYHQLALYTIETWMNLFYSHANASMLFTPNFPEKQTRSKTKTVPKNQYNIFTKNVHNVYTYMFTPLTLYVAGCYMELQELSTKKKFLFHLSTKPLTFFFLF